MEKLVDVFIQYMREDGQIPEEIRTSERFQRRTAYFAGGIICLYGRWFRGQIDGTLTISRLRWER